MDVKIMLSRSRPGLGHNEARRLIQRAISAALREERSRTIAKSASC